MTPLPFFHVLFSRPSPTLPFLSFPFQALPTPPYPRLTYPPPSTASSQPPIQPVLYTHKHLPANLEARIPGSLRGILWRGEEARLNAAENWHAAARGSAEPGATPSTGDPVNGTGSASTETRGSASSALDCRGGCDESCSRGRRAISCTLTIIIAVAVFFSCSAFCCWISGIETAYLVSGPS